MHLGHHSFKSFFLFIHWAPSGWFVQIPVFGSLSHHYQLLLLLLQLLLLIVLKLLPPPPPPPLLQYYYNYCEQMHQKWLQSAHTRGFLEDVVGHKFLKSCAVKWWSVNWNCILQNSRNNSFCLKYVLILTDLVNTTWHSSTVWQSKKQPYFEASHPATNFLLHAIQQLSLFSDWGNLGCLNYLNLMTSYD